MKWSTHELLSERHLLELHAVHASIGGTEQRSCCDDEAVLHDDNLPVLIEKRRNTIVDECWG